MKEVHLTCISCPLGCPLTVTLELDQVVSVTGNTCKRGEAYGRKEVTHPTRVVTTTVPVEGGSAARISVKTREAIPKDKIFDCIRALKNITAAAPVQIGDVILPNVAGTCVDVIATRSVQKQ